MDLGVGSAGLLFLIPEEKTTGAERFGDWNKQATCNLSSLHSLLAGQPYRRTDEDVVCQHVASYIGCDRRYWTPERQQARGRNITSVPRPCSLQARNLTQHLRQWLAPHCPGGRSDCLCASMTPWHASSRQALPLVKQCSLRSIGSFYGPTGLHCIQMDQGIHFQFLNRLRTFNFAVAFILCAVVCGTATFLLPPQSSPL